MEDLSDYRKRIDQIDIQLARLFEQRMNLVLDIARIKEANKLSVFQADREKAVLENAVSVLENKNYTQDLKAFFRMMMHLSKDMEHRLMSESTYPCLIEEGRQTIDKSKKIGYQGVSGSFSEEALVSFFGGKSDRACYMTFEDVFIALDRHEVDYGILPIENSSTGAIAQVYDLLLKYGFFIAGETYINVQQHLMGLKGATLAGIREVYSHAQGIEQSSEFLKAHMDWERIPYFNTAISAKMVSESGDPSKAAIASRYAANLYGLEILAESINDEKDNNTRFIIIGRDKRPVESANKISIVFTVENEPGSLYNLLRHFVQNNINMSKIESRPIKNRPWEYFFYADLEGDIDSPELAKAFTETQQVARFFKLLGIYSKAEH